MVPFVDLKKQYQDLRAEIDGAIQAVIRDTAFISGKYAQQFEEEFAQFIGIENCISCANGTDSLEIILKVLGIGPGDEVIVPANTWISTSECVSTVGAKPVFVDNDPVTYTINPALIEAKITASTRAIIPVHLYGCPADMDPILDIARRHELYVIEDCAQSHGATYKGRVTGTMGIAGSFSFYPGKNLGAYGDAGAIVTHDEGIARTCRMMANHGRLGKHDHALEGRNSRMDGIQAAILSAKLPYLAGWTDLRIRNAQHYQSLLFGTGFTLPVVPEGYRHVFHLYVVQVDQREACQQYLKEKGIETGIHYPIALPLLQAYAHNGYKSSQFPAAYAGMSRILSLPMYAELTHSQIESVVQELKSFS